MFGAPAIADDATQANEVASASAFSMAMSFVK
jgi:hypothetical protein